MHLRLHTSMLMVDVKNTQFEVGSWQVADFEGMYFIGQVCHGELNGAGLANYMQKPIHPVRVIFFPTLVPGSSGQRPFSTN